MRLNSYMKASVMMSIALALGPQPAAVAVPSGTIPRAVAPLSTPVKSGPHAFAVLHTFSQAPDGTDPTGNLDLGLSVRGWNLVRTLYGTDESGGGPSGSGGGTIFTYALDSNSFTPLHVFAGAGEGSSPEGGLANNETNYFVTGQPQFGVTSDNGAFGLGVVYKIGANGVPVVMHTFTGKTDGGVPRGRLTRFIDGNYYGTTSDENSGTKVGNGSVFRFSSSGAFATIYRFTGASGRFPTDGLALSINIGNGSLRSATALQAMTDRMTIPSASCAPYLYGVTVGGGPADAGTIFRITATGALQTLYSFTGGIDGQLPSARLTSDLHGNLYGVTAFGGASGTGAGASGNGVVFKIPYNSSTPQVIHDFGNGSAGAQPFAQLTLALNGNLYGTTTGGGAYNRGTVFELSPSGDFADIHDFSATEGGDARGGLVDAGDGKLYGTAESGPGIVSSGILYSIAE